MARAAKGTTVSYDHEPEASHTLRFPFSVDGEKVDHLDLFPPTFESLKLLRAKDPIDASDVLAICSTLDVVTIGRMRWPDVDAALALALEMIPPDLAAHLTGAAEEIETSPQPEAPPASTEAPIELAAPDEEPGSLVDFFS